MTSMQGEWGMIASEAHVVRSNEAKRRNAAGLA